MTRFVVNALTFTPLRIDYGESCNVIVGTLGELCKFKQEQNLEQQVRPFPAQVTSGVVLEDRWIGTWVDHELKYARMAALPLDTEWSDGIGREHIRISEQGTNQYDPAGAIWSQSLDSEPMALTKVDYGFCFAILGRGIYYMDGDANEIWRVSIPVIGKLTKGSYLEINSIFQSGEELHVFYGNNSIAILDKKNGSLLRNSNLRLPNRIESVFQHESRYLISMATGGIAILEDIEQEITIHKTPGPVIDAHYCESGWMWTGWRHDGKLCNGRIETVPRRDIGVAIIEERVLSNDGVWSDFGL